ncbi:MAG: flagellar hook-basal body protein [Planctomycetota bacterium]|jgi:flagellar basal-body rod protein FlgG
MNYGLYLAASGALTNLHRQEVLTNNLANATTVGFKPDLVFARQRRPERLEAGVGTDPQLLLEQLGGGPALMPTRPDLSQGALQATSNDLDVAIEGKGYLVVRTGTGSGPEDIRLTRDGRLSMNLKDELIMTTTGMRVLSTANRPIRLDRRQPVQINANGDVLQGGRTVATIQIAEPQDPDAIVKAGDNVLRDISNGPIARRPADGSLRQGHVESSGVEPITALKDLVNAVKSVEANVKMMQYHDHIMGQAINTMGRVA